MCKGSSGTNTVETQSAPPAQYLNAYSQAVGNAQNLAAQPYVQYPGSLQAALSPDQLAGIQGTENAQGMASPYINSAAQYINNSTSPLSPTLSPYFQGQNQNLNLEQGIAQNVSPSLNQYIGGANQNLNQEQNIGSSAMGTVSPFQQLGSSQINQYLDPYLSQVVGATQAEFNNQNAQQANQLNGSAVSSGAFGGDRQALAQSSLANQQQLAQAPTIANLENQGYSQALATAEQQQQQQLSTEQAQLSGLGLAGNLYQNNAAAQLQEGSLGMQGQQLAAGLYQNNVGALGQQAQTALGANEANSWLNSQAGYGMANLGNEAENTALTGANALLGTGSLEQQQAQQSLNIPYEQFLAQQSWPYQTAGWEAGIAEGLGSAAGGSSSTQYPGASVGSQVLGTGLAGAGLLGETGAFGPSGYLTGAGGLFGSGAGLGASALEGTAGGAAADAAAAGVLGGADASAIDLGALAIHRGGMVPHRAGGGMLGHDNDNRRMDWPEAKRAAGGASGAAQTNAPTTVVLTPGSYAGSPPVPQIVNGGGGMSGGASGGMGAVNNYLAGAGTSAAPAAAAPAAAAPAAAPPAPAAPSTASAASTLGISPTQVLTPAQGQALANYYATTGTPSGDLWPSVGGSSGGGGGARGGNVRHLDAGGDPAGDAPLGDSNVLPFTGGMGAPSGGGMSAPSSSGHGDWGRALLYAGLGIMGGNSPNAATNIGRGAMQGLQAAERERHENESEQQAASRLADEAEWHRQQIKIEDQKATNEAQHQKVLEGQSQQTHDLNTQKFGLDQQKFGLDQQKFGERSNEFWNGTMPWRQSNQDIALGKAITSRDQGQQRIDQGSQRLDQQKSYQDQMLAVRKQALDQTKDANDRRMIQTSTNQVLGSARSIINAHPEIKWADAVRMAGQSQGDVQSNVQTPPSSLPAQGTGQPAAQSAPQQVVIQNGWRYDAQTHQPLGPAQ